MALHPEADSAIEDIVNEAIVSDSNDSPVEIELNLNASDGIKTKIRKEFKYILDLLTLIKKHTKFTVTGILMVVSIIIRLLI